jgi:hypothetical protein
MSGEKMSKEPTVLPPPVAAPRIRHPHRLRNALALTAACGLFYLGTSSWESSRQKHIEYLDSLVGTSDAIHHRHKGFGLDPKKAEDIYL